MSTILNKIIEVRTRRLMEEKRRAGLEALEEAARLKSPPRGFVDAFERSRPCIIAEVKKASPSRGVIRQDLDVGVLASAYEAGGAGAISVLTEGDYFRGSISDLAEVRNRVSLPCLRKDFITDPYQIVEARAARADSFLLIAGLLDVGALRSLLDVGRQWGMEPLVEVHDGFELHRALQTDARIIGINNRDLETFNVDIDTTLRLMKQVPSDRITVSESGIRSREDVLRLTEAGARGFLIGETLVRSADPAAKIRELLSGF